VKEAEEKYKNEDGTEKADAIEHRINAMKGQTSGMMMYLGA